MSVRGRAVALAGVVTWIAVTALLLVFAATTAWLNEPLGIGTYRAGSANLAVAQIMGGGQRTLIPASGRNNWAASWSPDGKQLVYTRNNPTTNVGPLVVASSGGTDQRVLTHDGRQDYLADWSPNGKEIAYITQAGADTSTADLAVITATGRGARRLTRNHAWEYGASWSPDGRWIAYGSEQGGAWHIWLIHPDGSGAHILVGTVGGNAPDWSPDGRAIAFTSNRTGNDNIYVVPATGGRARRLTTGACHSDNARWSPDGKRLVYAVFCGHGWNDIAVMDADGSHVRKVTTTPTVEEEVPSWLPDGRHVAFTAFAVNRDSLWPGPTLRALAFGLIVALAVMALLLLSNLSGRASSGASRKP